MPSLPNVSAVNVLGDYDIAADRLAFIDGEGVCIDIVFSASRNVLMSSSHVQWTLGDHKRRTAMTPLIVKIPLYVLSN